MIYEIEASNFGRTYYNVARSASEAATMANLMRASVRGYWRERGFKVKIKESTR